MTEHSPLKMALMLVTELRQNADRMAAPVLTQSLARLEALLGQSLPEVTPPPPAPAPAGAQSEAGGMQQEVARLKEQIANFTSTMVHELRKPLTSIRGYSDMLGKPGMIGPLNDMQSQFVQTIRINAIKMEGLISDISDMNKLGVGRIRLELAEVMPAQIVEDARKQVEPINAEYGHTIQWDAPDSLPMINSDIRQLTKVVVKLVTNAIQYTPKPGTIVVRVTTVDGGLRFSVTDSGIGLNEKDLSNLGKPFYRGDHELVTNTKGYGLGIPVVMGFLHLMGSTLEFTGVPDQGSTFGFIVRGQT